VYIPKRFFKAAMRSRRSATSALALNLGLFVGDALENDDVLCINYGVILQAVLSTRILHITHLTSGETDGDLSL